MADAPDRPDGFLSRWSRRKLQGDAAPEPAVAAPVQVATPAPPAERAGRPVPAAGATTGEAPAEAPAEARTEAPPPPTLEQAQALTPESDFKPFMARGVSSEVRNTAMKKLFADPHFNVMDRMDVYIDDYSNPAPLAPETLRQMASAVFMKLVDEEPHPDAGLQETPHLSSDSNVAQSGSGQTPHTPDSQPPAPAPSASQLHDDDDPNADLRLQQDHAAGPPGPGRGTL